MDITDTSKYEHKQPALIAKLGYSNTLYMISGCITMTSPIGLWTDVLKPRVWHLGHRHLVFLQPEERPPELRSPELTQIMREGGAKYNRMLNETFLGDQQYY